MNRFIFFSVFMHTGVLFDATGSYSFPFYLAAVCFFLCACFIAALPISNHIGRQQRQFPGVKSSPLPTVSSKPETV